MDWGEFGKNIIGKKMIVLLAVTGAVYFFLQYLTPLLAPVLLAMLFVTIFGPMMKRMNRKLHFPRPLSAIVLLILATLLLAVLLWVLSSWVLGSLPVWIRSMDAREQEWLAMVRDLCHGVGEIIGVDASYLENTVSGRLQEGLDSLEENILPGMLSQSMQYVRWFAELGGFLVTFLIASVLLAKDYDGILPCAVGGDLRNCPLHRYLCKSTGDHHVGDRTDGSDYVRDRGDKAWSAMGDPGGDSGCAAFYRHGGGAGATGNLAAIGGKLR